MDESRLGSSRCRRDGFRRRPDLAEDRFGSRADGPEEGPARCRFGHAGRRGQERQVQVFRTWLRARSRPPGGIPCFARSRAARPSSRSFPRGPRSRRASVVCELDSASLRDQLTNQKIARQAAEAVYQNAKLAPKPPRSQSRNTRKEPTRWTGPRSWAKSSWPNPRSRKPSAELERTRRARQWLSNTHSRKEAAIGSADVLAELEVENRLASIEQTRMREQFSLEKTQGRTEPAR